MSTINTPIKPITVYAESTPNPAAMKFVCNVMLLDEGSVEYLTVNDAVECPLAKQLFAFSGVKGVFITANFVTVIKEPGIDWYEITGILREFIRGFLAAGEKIFTANPFKKETQQINQQKIESTPETEQKIISLLEEYVKPAVEQDGGAINFRSFKDGIVTVTLKGSCSGCPSSTLTLKSGIENLLKSMVPEVTEVVAEAG
jgi:NFU1 iron-sulfur cluster scaffold homolog, mitochondrial